jgi:hypothetical protein
VCAYHEQAYPLSSSGGVQRGSPPQADAEGLVVDSPQDEGVRNSKNSLESPFDKGGLRGFGARGLKTDNRSHLGRGVGSTETGSVRSSVLML